MANNARVGSRYLLRSLTANRPNVMMTEPSVRMSSSEVQALKVTHDEGNMEFFIELGKDKAFLQYDFIGSDSGAVDLQHTVVPEVFRGQGVAKVLAKTALDYFASRDQPMKLTCWYLKKYYNENPLPHYKITD